jgi:hypothetical protein
MLELVQIVPRDSSTALVGDTEGGRLGSMGSVRRLDGRAVCSMTKSLSPEFGPESLPSFVAEAIHSTSICSSALCQCRRSPALDSQRRIASRQCRQPIGCAGRNKNDESVLGSNPSTQAVRGKLRGAGTSLDVNHSEHFLRAAPAERRPAGDKAKWSSS